MGMPTDVPVIDTMIGFPAKDMKAQYAFITQQTKDKESKEEFAFPAEYMFKSPPDKEKALQETRFGGHRGAEFYRITVNPPVACEGRAADPNGSNRAIEFGTEFARRSGCCDIAIEQTCDRSQQGIKRIHCYGLQAVRGMQCDYAAGKVVISASLEPGVFHHAAQLVLARVHADRLRKVLITVRVVGNEFSERGQDLEGVQIIGWLERRVRFGKLQYQGFAGRLQDPENRCQRRVLVGHIA
jgi:hypothetical protein